MNSPCRIYNCDETILPLDSTREKAVTLKKAKHGFRTLLSWMNKVFLEFAVPQCSVMLFVDGNKSHLTLELINLARKKDVILFCLPPHITHALQPLDVAVFKSFKDQLFKSVCALSFSKKNFIVSKPDLAAVVKEPFEKGFSMSNIKDGFSKARIYPFNPNTIDSAKMKPSEFYRQQSSSSDRTNAEISSVLVPTTPSPVVSSLDPTSRSSSISVISESSISNSSLLPEKTVNVSCSSTQSPPLFSSTPVSPTSNSERGTSITNPLVTAGLLPSYLANLFPSPEDHSLNKPKRRRITKAQVLTENKYVEIMKEKDRQEKEAEELKKKRKEERKEKRERETEERERGRKTEEEEGKRGREGEEKEREGEENRGKEKEGLA